MRTIIFFMSLLFPLLHMMANEKVRGYVTNEKKEAIVGANVLWVNTAQAVTTDDKGYFEIDKRGESDRLICSFMGLSTDTIHVKDATKILRVRMQSTVQLGEVNISARALGTIGSRITPLQTQTINYNELCRAACCNLSESFETNASVDVNYSDAATGAKQIRLLGLSGAYVQMLTENAPNFRGAASLYGLDYVPGPWMESIQVSKGTSSVKNGYEAITGQINVEYKKPQTADPISVNLFASDAGRAELNVDVNKMLTEKLGTGLLMHYSNDRQVHDDNNDGFLDQPKLQQINLFNRWYYKSDSFISQFGVKYINEQRESGLPMHVVDPYMIDIKTNRAEAFAKNGYILDKEKNTSVALILSGAYHDQKSMFGHKAYDVAQTNMYASLLYETELSKMHHLSTGLSLNYDGLNEYHRMDIGTGLPNAKRDETVFGGYAQYTFNWNDKLILLAGIRGDHHNEYGLFATPRLHLKYNLARFLHLRASVGKGFRSVNVLAENNFLLASSRKLFIADDLKMEEATNYGASAAWYIPLFGKELNVTTEYYKTNFQNQVVTDLETAGEVSFYNLQGKSYSNNWQIEASYPFFKGFTATAAYRKTDAKSTYDGVLQEKPLTNRYKALLTSSYQTPLRKWQFDYTIQLNGGGRMPAPDAVNPLWNKEFDSFTVMNAQVTKFFRTWSVYLGAENLLNFRQDHPIIDASNPNGDNFDATMVWGPVHGRKLYIGFRWSISKD